MLYLAFNTKSLVSILSTFATNLLDAAFLTTSFFTTSLNLLKSTEIGTNFKLAKFVFNAKPEVSTCEIFSMSVFVA